MFHGVIQKITLAHFFLRHGVYTRKGLCLSKKMWLFAALVLTVVFTLLKSLHQATIACQVMEEYNNLPTTQTNKPL